MAKHHNKRVPKLRFTNLRQIGWHVTYRDRDTGIPHKHRFGIEEREREPEARLLYHAWVLDHLGGKALPTPTTSAKNTKPTMSPSVLSGSVLDIASGLTEADRVRVRKDGEPRRRGSIVAPVFRDRKKQLRDFLEFLNDRHGSRAVARIRLPDLSMEDIENYNALIVRKGFSASQVAKRMQLVKAIIDRAGRPEHGRQVLAWNWDSRDVAHGSPTKERAFPTVDQLRRLLIASEIRGKTMIWLGLGLGLGAKDLASIRVGQITREAFDLRRPKTGVERFGETPYLVWLYVSKYQSLMKRPSGQLLFVTRNGVPLVQSTSNAVTQWWGKLGARIKKKGETIPGFYTLRHLGATEFGSRPGTSIGDVKRWLGHSASSHVADLYMRPVKPEYRELIKWVRCKVVRRSQPCT